MKKSELTLLIREEIKLIVNESTKSSYSGAVWFSNVNIPNFKGSTVKAEKECNALGQALVGYWEKNKPINQDEWQIKDMGELNLNNKGKKDYSFTVVKKTKPMKDLNVSVRYDDKDIRGNIVDSVFVKITRVG